MARRDPRYRGHHDQMRRVYARTVAAGAAVCVRCGKPIAPGEAWDLDHVDGGGPHDYAGPAHGRCNRQAGARKRNAGRSPVATGARWSRHWYGGYDERCPACRSSRRACEAAAPAAEGRGSPCR